MVKTIQFVTSHKKFLLLLIVFLLSMLNLHAQGGNPDNTESLCVQPGNQTTVLRAESFNWFIAGSFDYKWYKQGSNTVLSTSSQYNLSTTSSQDGTTMTYVCTYKVHVFGVFQTTKTIHVIVNKSMPDIISSLAVDANNCNLVNVQFSAPPTSEMRFSWGFGTTAGQNRQQTDVTLAALQINIQALGNHTGIWIQKRHRNCDPNETKTLALQRISNLRITQQTCNGSSVLKLSVDGPNDTGYTWKYRDHNNVLHTLTTTGGRAYNVPASAHPIVDDHTFFVEHASATVCGDPLSVVVTPRIPQAINISISQLCNNYQLVANGSFDLPYPYIFKWVKLTNGNNPGPMSGVEPIYTNVPYVLLPSVSGTTTYRVEVYIGSESATHVCGSFPYVRFNASNPAQGVLTPAATVTSVSNSCTSTASQIILNLNSPNVRVKKWESKKTSPSSAAWTTLVGATDNAIDVLQFGFTTSDFPRYFRATYEILDENGQVICEQISEPTSAVQLNAIGGGVQFFTSGNLNTATYRNKPVVITGNYTLQEDVTLCSLTINPGYTFTVPATKTLTVTNAIYVAPGAQLIIEDKGSLIQVTDGVENVVQGTFQQRVNTAAVTRFDYTYWSSPVQGYTLNTLSPETLSDKYHSFDPNATSGWINHVGGNHTMQTGKGYIVRAPQSFSTTAPAIYNAQFVGTPNNGHYQVPIYRGLAVNDGTNLIGNPYPSSISVEAFLLLNHSVIEGYVELWSHSTPLSDQTAGSFVYNYSQSDYVKCNLTGNTFSEHPVLTNQFPKSEIASGQGFIVKFRDDNVGEQADVVFRNAMRSSNNGTRFFRYAYQTEAQNSQGNSYTAYESTQRDRLWLHISRNANEFKQALVGYIDGASNAKDDLYDAPADDLSNSVNIYTVLNNEPLTIQGRSWPLQLNDRVQLGYKVAATGEYKIGLGLYDGQFATQQAVYLFDRLLDISHDLKASDYAFMSAAGQFNDRFEIRYVNATLGSNDLAHTEFIAFAQQQQVYVQAPKAVRAIRVFDATARLVYQTAVNGENEFQTPPLALARQMLLVQIECVDGSTQIQKIPFN